MKLNPDAAPFFPASTSPASSYGLPEDLFDSEVSGAAVMGSW